jgi:molybdate/tungstate transport system substrate-binding protein
VRVRAGITIILVALCCLIAACGSQGGRSASKRVGTANVAYAGSLQLVMEKYLGPAFTKAEGYSYQGRGGGSLGLAQEVLAGEITPNVFISVGSGPLTGLEPKLTTWAVRVASSPLVVAYYPQGTYSSELDRIREGKLPLRDLFTLMAKPGFRLGRTDPATDPQGEAFAMMISLGTRLYGLPPTVATADLGGANPGGEMYPETSLEAQLQAGQLDAASSFKSEAMQLKLPYISLPAAINFGDPADLSAYRAATLRLTSGRTVHGFLLDIEATVLGHGQQAAADSFVAYLAGSAGRSLLSREGYSTPPMVILGRAQNAPEALRKAVARG